MRAMGLVLCFAFLTPFLHAQKKYLVSSNDEVIPVPPGSSASGLMNEWKERRASSPAGVCADKFYFGYDPSLYPTTSTMGGHHRDVFGMWFVMKAPGTIDTIYWEQHGPMNAYDSTVYIRVHSSVIGPGYGPGIRPGPFNPPRQQWGYWVNTNDLDQGIAAFIDDATDTTWISTIRDSPVPSRPPIAEERWGYGGFPVRRSSHWYSTIQSVAMSDLYDTIGVTTGEVLFFSMRIAHGDGPNGGHMEASDEGWTYVGSENRIVTTDDEDYPSRMWKFYEHDLIPPQKGRHRSPSDTIHRGWVARGGFSDDSLDVASYNFWYLLTVTENVPPSVINQTTLRTSFHTGPRIVQAVLEDCNPANPANAGVSIAVIRWSPNNVPQGDITMSNIGGDTWKATLPGQSPGSTITYRIVATDFDAAVNNGPSVTYSIVPFGTQWYSIETGFVCVPQDITGSGTKIDTSEFFSLPDPPFTGAGASPQDDGTAGPFDMGGDFILFGDHFRYAWVGVNGAIALSKSATDTSDVNANGFPADSWTFPDDAVWGGRADPGNQELMPPMFIAPYWADHILADTAGIYGGIYYGNGGDTCQFIVEWDSIGAFDALGSLPDETKFRVILNRCKGTVEFQYDLEGTTGLDSASLIGMQGDSNAVSGPEPGWVYLNRNGYPIETRIHDNHCVKFHPNISMVASDAWNMVAVSATPNGPDYGRANLFPTAVSPAFEYAAGYVEADPLVKGKGYWLKFDDPGIIGSSPSTFDHDVTATVQAGWNMIGGPSGFVSTGDIQATGTTVTSSYLSYGDSGYYAAATIQPGKGYWVKVDGAGTLGMNSSGAVPTAAPRLAEMTDFSMLNRIIFSDAAGHSQTLYLGEANQAGTDPASFELPPVPPAGAYDVRFTSQRMLETYPGQIVEEKAYEYPITIQSVAWPVVVRWEIINPVNGNSKMVLSDAADGKSVQQVMEGSGTVTIGDPGTKSLVIRITDGTDFPVEFALGQNYPNPFNPVTHFTVEIPRATVVEVSVHDLLGRRIATLLDGKQAPGRYTLKWDGRDGNGIDVPTGMYIVRMKSGQFNAARKTLLLR